ncbi:MAG: aminotransferase class III-fold pyridoxal phosphate-dependent enzyme [Flavobacterium sp.]|nr:aminotransferase class III-fold pyridoxal phosphate-dependent enzyme [Flavobacterium sp.]
MNPWADMVRFARSGGEANSIAIRIARAASGRDKVAICGYHGWHDWYLSANHNDGDELSGHLLPGLSPNGVPKNLKDTVYPFNYNNYEELLSIVEIIFDECTSGFRETFGGIYQKYGVEPDMAMYGKTIGNGYALTAVVGTRAVMEATQNTFISSTFWTERIGPTAALATLKVMERVKSWETITEMGNKMRNGWQKLADAHHLTISISGIPALSTYSFVSNDAMAYKTLITQEMLKKGFLASTNFYASTAHNDANLELYFEALDYVYQLIAQCEKGNLQIENLLKGPICHGGFKRLN